jgi:hypothetical protein
MQTNSRLGKFTNVFGFVMVGLYFFLGCMIIFSGYFRYLPDNARVVFGIFLIAYGAFRFVRLYYKIKNAQKEEEE